MKLSSHFYINKLNENIDEQSDSYDILNKNTFLDLISKHELTEDMELYKEQYDKNDCNKMEHANLTDDILKEIEELELLCEDD